MLGLEDYLLSVVSLLPDEKRKDTAIRLRTRLLQSLALQQAPPSTLPYVGLTPAADANVRALIDESWGQTL